MLDNSVDCCPRIVRLCIHTNTDLLLTGIIIISYWTDTVHSLGKVVVFFTMLINDDIYFIY